MRNFGAFPFIAVLLLSIGTPQLSAQVDFCKRVDQIPIEECRALETFFRQTRGTQWTDNTGWFVEDEPCYWIGIACTIDEWPRHITRIRLIDNNVDGPLPGHLSRLSHLRRFIIENRVRSKHYGTLTAHIPAEISELEHLEVIRLGNNNLVGFVPPELANLKKLRVLDLADNDLDQYIPPLLAQLTTLEELDLSGNRLSGPILPSLSELRMLRKLLLNDNSFSGPIPGSLGMLSNLKNLDLSNNDLEGTIPDSFGDLHSLFSLNLANNALSGSVPPTIDQLRNLNILDLSGNMLEHAVGAATAHYLSEIPFCDLSNNQPSFCLAGVASKDAASICSLQNQPNCGSTLGAWVSAFQAAQRGDEVVVSWQMKSIAGVTSITVEDMRSSRVLATVSADGFPAESSFDVTLSDLEPGAYALNLGLQFTDGSLIKGFPIDFEVLPRSLVMEAYPNPAPGAFTIRAASHTGGNILVEILDAAGRLQRRFEAVLPTGGAYHEMRVALDDLAPGLYRLSIQDVAGNVETVMITML